MLRQFLGDNSPEEDVLLRETETTCTGIVIGNVQFQCTWSLILFLLVSDGGCSIQTNLEVIRLSIVPSPLGTTRLSLVYSFTGEYNQYQVMDLTDPDTGGKKNRYQALWNLWSRITHQTLNMLTLHQCLKLSFLTQPCEQSYCPGLGQGM